MGNALYCLLIISNICIHKAEDIKVLDHGLGADALITNENYKIDILLRSDYMEKPDWENLNLACRENSCIGYFKYCSSEKQYEKCSYYFGSPGANKADSITIMAKDFSNITEAERNIGVISAAGLSLIEIPFSDLSVQSGTNQPPYCGHRPPQDQWCQNK